MLPKVEEISREAVLYDWLEELKEEADVDTLVDIRDQITEALEAAKQNATGG
jgi:hypothetical protein